MTPTAPADPLTGIESFYRSRCGVFAAGALRAAIARLPGHGAPVRHQRCWPTQVVLGVCRIPALVPAGRLPADSPVRLLELLPSCLAAPPADGGRSPGCDALVDETALPLADRSVDLLVVLHCLEYTAAPDELMRELWRVLHDHGEVVIVVPRRGGTWRWAGGTPFAGGRPWSRLALAGLLGRHMFATTRLSGGLYVPPWGAALMRTGGLAGAWERHACRLPWGGGVLIACCHKNAAAPLRLSPHTSPARTAVPVAG